MVDSHLVTCFRMQDIRIRGGKLSVFSLTVHKPKMVLYYCPFCWAFCFYVGQGLVRP
ncbi:unnamed protein product [Brassica napus]|uniref:(rape) hypothetical protein n=1 Tax=Brassica napus TaxID=3708 RepID=A0A816QYL9_BRANA|nr:unnamed protein product [Brassica napus]